MASRGHARHRTWVLKRSIVALACLLTAPIACDSDDDEAAVCPGAPELVKVHAPDTAAAGDTIAVSFDVTNFEFSMEGEHDHGDHDHGDHDSGGDESGGDESGSGGFEFRAAEAMSTETGCYVGHVHVYVDDLMTDPIAQVTVPSADIVLPSDLAPGEYNFIYRLHDATHKIITPEVIVERTLTIQ